MGGSFLTKGGSDGRRVYQVAKELGVSTEIVLNLAREFGEYVSGPSAAIQMPVIRWIAEQVRQRYPEAVLALAAAQAAVAPTPASPPAGVPASAGESFWREAARLAGRYKNRSPGGSAQQERAIRVADLSPMARQLLKHRHGHGKPTLSRALADTVKRESLAWARAGFDEQTAMPWIEERIPPTEAQHLARHGITPPALNTSITVAGQRQMLLSVAIRSGLISGRRACSLLAAAEAGTEPAGRTAEQTEP